MYNYYIHEKQTNEELQKEKQRKDDNHKNLTERLVKNYNSRIEKFVLEMVKNPMIIIDYDNPIRDIRKVSKNVDARKEFGLNHFMTDKERIKRYFDANTGKVRRRDHECGIISKQFNNNQSIYSTGKDINKKHNKHLQRNLNHLSASASILGKKNAAVLKENLKEKEQLSSNDNDDDNDNNIIHLPGLSPPSNNNSILAISNRNKQRNNNHTNDSHPNHYKTHFKAAMYLAGNYHYKKMIIPNIANNNKEHNRKIKYNHINKIKRSSCNISNSQHRNSNEINLDKSSSMASLPKALSSSSLWNQSNNKNITSNDQQYKAKSFILDYFSNKFPINEDNIDFIASNPLLYNLNFHSIKKINADHSYINHNDSNNQDKLDYLKQLTFEIDEQLTTMNKRRSFNDELSNDNSTNSIKEQAKHIMNPLHLSSLYKSRPDIVTHHKAFKFDDKKILVDNEPIDRYRYDLIAKKILRKCNYSHGKNPNNNTCLKKGEGKLMITSGLTINEFIKKYNNNNKKLP